VHEQRVIGARADDPHLDLVLRVPPGVPVDAVEELPRVEVVDGAFLVDVEHPRFGLDVHVAPPDVVGRALLVDDALVRGAASGLLAGERHEGARRGDRRSSLVLQGRFVERRRRRVPNDVFDFDAVLFEREGVGHGAPVGCVGVD
jgi:hypothetical protein